MNLKYCLIIFLLVISFTCYGQGYYWGMKGGLALGTQSWNGANQRNPLFSYQGDLFYETFSEEGSSAFFMSSGLHVRGSKIITQSGSYIDQSGKTVFYPSSSISFQFRNITAILGIKKYFTSKYKRLYYDFGLRGEYNVSNNLSDDNGFIRSGYDASEENVNKFVYGLTLGGGIDIPINEKVSTFFEIGFNQDLSKQYYSLSKKAYDPYNKTFYVVPEQTIRNFSVDITFGIKFLRKNEYID